MKQKNHSFKLIMAVLIVIVSLLAVPISSFMGFELPVLFETKVSAATYGYYTYTVSNGEATITDYNTSIRGNVVIPDTLDGYPVTRIGWNAFEDCTGLTSITIPDSVTSIGGYAFYNCTGLTSITIPDSVTSIGNWTFSGCTDLTSITIPNSVTSIGSSAFYDCTGLTSVTIPDSVTSIGSSAFYSCTGLTKINWNAESVSDFDYISVFYNAGTAGDGIDVVFGDNVKRIPACAFKACTGLTSVTIPDSVTSIGSSAFYDCTGLTSVTIPDSVTSIGSSAFCDCTGLTSVTIPDSVTSIGSSAFYDCTGLTSVTIGNSVTSIGDFAFYECTGLTSVHITDLEAWCKISFGSSSANPLYYAKKLYINGELATNITIPDSVTSIGNYAFECCTGLASVTIPYSVTSIGYDAFYGCTGLTKINWNAESVSDFTYNSEVFYNAGTAGDGIDVVFGDNVKRIPAYAFYVSDSSYRPKIKSVTIGNSVTSIGESAFNNCTDLTSVTIGNSVTSIGYDAFYGCTNLTKINWNAESVSNFGVSNVFYNAGTAGDGIDVVFGDNVKRIPAYAFYVSDSSYRPKIKSVTIGNSVTSIGESAFNNCTDLTSVTIGNSVTSIGGYAFEDCTGLTKINWNAESVSDFGFSNVFYNAGTAGDGIDVIFGDSVKRIPNYVFFVDAPAYRPKLKSVNIGNSVTSIGVSAFYGCIGLTSVTIPDSVTSIGVSAFYGCIGLTSVTIPDSVTSIGWDAFSGCTGLKSVTIGNSVTSIDDFVFDECSGLETVKFTGKPPEFSNFTFYGYNKTVLYPYGISEWKSAIKSKYGGYFTWICYSTGSLTDLQVNTLPKKTVYNQGEEANYSGLKLTATWSDGFSTVITPDSKIYNISLSGFSTETPGLKTVTATLDGKSAQFKIGVHKTTTFTEDQSKYPESDHNYADKLNQTKTYKCPDAIKLIVTFSDKTFVEKDGDYIYVNGKKYTGDQLAGKTITVSGNTLTVQLVSDSYGNYYGYSIDKIEVTKIEHTNKTTTTKATTSADGKIVTACTICRKISKTVVIPKIASISLSAKSYTYDGKVKTPTVTVENSKGTTLKNGTDYTVSYASGRKTPGQYAVKITFKGNYSGSKTLYFTILPGVTSKIATATNSSAIKIAWKAVPGATGYRVYQYDAKTKKYVALKTTTGTSYTVTKLKSGTNYKFAVKAYSTVNGKVYWASGYKTVTATTNPGTPTLKVTAGTKKAALSWNKQTGATGYVVYMATSQNGKYSKIATLKGNSKVSYTKTGLTKGKTYYFKVAAYTVANGKTLYSGYSSVKAVKIK